jgi:hypothetical protein
MSPKPKHQPPTPEQVRAAQRQQAERDTTRANLPAVAPTPAVPAVPALRSTDDYFGRNPDRPTLGRPVRPNLKIGKWLFADSTDDEPLPDGAEYAVLYTATLAGHVRLEEGQPPQYELMPLFSPEFTRHSREELGDLDPAHWPISQFDGAPTDPWKEAVYVPLEQLPSGELFTIQIQSKPRSSSIFAIDSLLSHCRQMARRDPDSYPIVRLAISNYESRKYGMQFKPSFKIVGKTPKAGVAQHDTSTKADFSDEIPY